MSYATDDTVLFYRSDILSLGVSDWSEQYEMADVRLNEYLDRHWYRSAAEAKGIDWRTHQFDSAEVVSDSSLVYSATALALALIYTLLAKNMDEDPFNAQRDYWQKEHERSMRELVATGVDYTWPFDGSVTPDTPRGPRRLYRG